MLYLNDSFANQTDVFFFERDNRRYNQEPNPGTEVETLMLTA